jgi:hypothetical protein
VIVSRRCGEPLLESLCAKRTYETSHMTELSLPSHHWDQRDQSLCMHVSATRFSPQASSPLPQDQPAARVPRTPPRILDPSSSSLRRRGHYWCAAPRSLPHDALINVVPRVPGGGIAAPGCGNTYAKSGSKWTCNKDT